MFASLPNPEIDLTGWTWQQIEPYYQDLLARSLTTETVETWLADWSRLSERVSEMQERLYVATTCNTVDQEAEQRFNTVLEGIYPAAQAAEQQLKKKLLETGLEPQGFEIPLRQMQVQARLFREDNLPLLSQEQQLSSDYNKILGSQTVIWNDEEITPIQLQSIYQEPNRALRERAWRLDAERQLVDREAINLLWQKLLRLRKNLAVNAGFGGQYRTYRWQQLLRFDYTPADCADYHQAIEDVVVPAAARLYEKRRQRLGVKTLRPWDLDVDPEGRPPLRPFKEVDELQRKALALFRRVDPQLGAYFEVMLNEGLLDLDNRKYKVPGGYCALFAATRRPFIFMNATGLHRDVQTLLHEGGHAFHVFETNHLPYFYQFQYQISTPSSSIPVEFAEAAAEAMELLAAPYLTHSEGGFYSETDAARARVEQLEREILFLPYMAVVDAFQHWVYENLDVALDPANCDARWMTLWNRFMRGVDWNGLEQELMTGWQRQPHIHREPFYYVEYGLAQLGAVQIWRNALKDQARAVTDYRHALSLGNTLPLPELYAAAGAKLAFDAKTLHEIVTLMEKSIDVPRKINTLTKGELK